jgi:hypothetical protein
MTELTTIHIRGERFLWIPEEARQAIIRTVPPIGAEGAVELAGPAAPATHGRR